MGGKHDDGQTSVCFWPSKWALKLKTQERLHEGLKSVGNILTVQQLMSASSSANSFLSLQQLSLSVCQSVFDHSLSPANKMHPEGKKKLQRHSSSRYGSLRKSPGSLLSPFSAQILPACMCVWVCVYPHYTPITITLLSPISTLYTHPTPCCLPLSLMHYISEAKTLKLTSCSLVNVFPLHFTQAWIVVP